MSTPALALITEADEFEVTTDPKEIEGQLTLF